ncbi:phosphotransferase [uncultured Bifidobacterium sp.]|uniref:phosphotransferase enzyme family protein n=1 Tax=uncultured Bifidobacterium sp. TaxID=165187 RepID=UPI0026181BDE|nr:phosphotransferase [uncultured Bifidobacterium sp.]
MVAATSGAAMDSGDDPQLDIVAQRWPDITLAEADSLVGLIRGGDGVRARGMASHSGRPTAAAALVDTSRGLLFIKRYTRSVRDVETITPYHRFVAYLADRGVPTPRFLGFESTDGGTVLVRGDFVYEAYWAAAGEDEYGSALTWDPPRAPDHARSLGAFLAQIDCAAAGFDEPALAPNGMSNSFGVFAQDDIDGAVESWLECRPSVRGYLAITDRDLHADLDVVRTYSRALSGVYPTLEERWTHGDPHVSNFLWKGGRPAAVIDFGLADRNTAVFDVAMLLERHCIQWVDVMNGKDDAYRIDVARDLLEGYTSVRPLSDIEKTVLPDVLAISQAQSGLSWLQYYMDGTHRMEDAAWCYDVCFLAHTRWFGSDSGRRFLDALRGILDEVD